MLRNFLNWRTSLAAVAIIIATGTIWYVKHLSTQLQLQEVQKVNLWVAAKNTELQTDDTKALNLAGLITTTNTTIPIIWTNETDSIIDFVNVPDTAAQKQNKSYNKDALQNYKSINAPIVWVNPLDSTQKSKLYFGTSPLIRQLNIFPLIQLIVVALFIIITIVAINTRNKSTQNQVWAGLAKETAHQLGTPISSLQGWVEVLKDTETPATIVTEIQKDISRLELISDRFGKIGSSPKLEPHAILPAVTDMVTYMKKRAANSITIKVTNQCPPNLQVPISLPLINWVLENLIKNALDAMTNQGSITLALSLYEAQLCIDVTDTGKGIPRNKWAIIFKPGYTTKKRGWGLGLSLTKRIVTQYHSGKIFVKESEPNKRTTIRVLLPLING